MLPRETIAAFRRGERAAFEELERTYAHLVRAVVSRFWRGAFDREEAMQEVWLHIWKNRAAIDEDRAAELGGWVATVARRRCFDLVRGSTPAVPLEDVDEPAAEDPRVDFAELTEIRAAVAAFTQRLRPQWRRFFELHFVEGHPYEEVAARLHISKLRCKYMKKVLAMRARNDSALLAALSRTATGAPRAS